MSPTNSQSRFFPSSSEPNLRHTCRQSKARGIVFLFAIMALIVACGLALDSGNAWSLPQEDCSCQITVKASSIDLEVQDQTGETIFMPAGSEASFSGSGPDHIRITGYASPECPIQIDVYSMEGQTLEDPSLFENGAWYKDVTFTGIDKVIVVDAPKPSAGLFATSRSTPSSSQPETGDVFTGKCKITSVSQNGDEGSVNYVVCSITSGILSELSSIQAYCADHSAAAPYTGQQFTYTYTVTSVNKKTGAVKGSFYATAVSGSTDGVSTDSSGRLTGYQRVSVYAEIERKYTGYMRLKKVSLAPTMTSSNDLYSLDGATYRIYEDKACEKRSEYADLVTKAGEYVKSEPIAAGTYYVKEIKASKGFQLSTKVNKVDVVAGETVDVGAEVNESTVVTDTPRHNPSKFVLGKFDNESSEGWAQGDATLQGAQYKVEYYAAQYTTVSAAQGSGTPKKQWTFSSDANGKINMCNEDYLVSGTLYKDRDGDIMFPLGTYVIYETKPSTGYLLSSEKVLIRIIKDPDGDGAIFKGNVVKGSALPGSNTAYSSYANVVIVKEPPIKGSVEVEKRDAATSDIEQGDAKFEGTTFEIRNQSRNPILYEGRKIGAGEVICTIAIGPDSNRRSLAARCLPYGTYSITEIAAGEGYRISDNAPKRFTITADGEVARSVDDAAFKNEVKTGFAKVTKSDNLSPDGFAQGDATLEGTQFEITNRSAKAIIYSGAAIEPDEIVTIFETDSKGKCAQIELPYGTYSIRETKASEGYLLTDSVPKDFKVRKDGEVIELSFANDPIRGSIEAEKRDLETGEMSAMGCATLEGTRFEIKNASKARVFVSGKEYAPGDICVITFTDSEGRASIEDRSLPYGTYTIKETGAPQGYLLSDTEERTFTIRQDGEIAFYGKDDIDGKARKGDAFYDQVMREDLSLEKIRGDSSKHLPNIPFEIVSKTTGERHVLVTDENGEARTEASWNPHTRNTNANDDFTEETIDPYAGIWWGVNANGTYAPPNDELRALVYDDYVFRELPVSGNDGLELVEFEFSAKRDNQVIDLGTIENNPPTIYPDPSITTMANDPADGDKLVYASSTCKLNDQVSYMNLVPGKDYVMHAMLLDVQTLELVEGAEAYKEFRPEATFGTLVMEMECDTLRVAGRDVVFFEELLSADEVICSHKDANDPSQKLTITKPEVVTYAHDSHDGDKIVVSDASSSVTDDVQLDNLEPNIRYSLYGIVVDAKTGIPAPINAQSEGKRPSEKDLSDFWGELLKLLKARSNESDTGFSFEIPYGERIDLDAVRQHINANPKIANAIDIVSKEFTATSSSMTTSLGYSVSSKDLSGDFVIFDLLLNDDTVVATHADTANADQSFQMMAPSISTTASDKTDGDHNILPSKEARVIDAIEYSGLMAGSQYEIHGTLMDKKTGQAIYIDDALVESSLSFTPNSTSGKIDVTFSFDASSLEDGTSLVVFEKLTKDGDTIAEHADINDEAQTVNVNTIAVPKNKVPGTIIPGGDGYYKTGVLAEGRSLALALLSLACLGALIIPTFTGKKRKHRR